MIAYVGWSDRYQQWAVIDGSGRQLFGESAPLVYSDRADAHAMVRLLWAGTVGIAVAR